MLSHSSHVRTGFDDLSVNERNVVLASARALLRAAQAGEPAPSLRGKNLALMTEDADDPDARRFARAASELGAHVSHIKPSVSKLDTPRDVRHTVGMLGRLYDAVACEGEACAEVRKLRGEAGVPVYEGLGSDHHPTAALAEALDGGAPLEERRRYVLQAVLVSSLG